MLSTSFEFRNRIAQNTKTLFKATLTLADGSVFNLTGEDVGMGSEAFTDSVSGNGSFDVGAAITNMFTFELKNHEGQWDDYDFTGATIVPYVGVQLSDGGTEWLLKGHYGIEQPERYGSAITLTCLDNMRHLDRPYGDVATTYPATIRTVVRDICARCGVTLLSEEFANSGYVVPERPNDSGTLTCVAVLSYAAQVTGNYARCDASGRLALSWYDTGAFESEGWLDGDRFDDATPYASGDTADGGSFAEYGAGSSEDGGGFGFGSFAILNAIKGLTMATDDVVITGVRVTAQDGDDGDGETALFGSEGYVLAIADNPLVPYGSAAAVAEQVGARVVGMRFRPFDVSALGNPAYEAGDPVIITDGKLKQYRSYITSLTYKVGHYEAFACNAETPARHNAQTFSSITEAIVQARNAIKQERTAREQAIANLASLLSTSSSGLYKTEDEQQDGSIIYYLHDKPTLAQSQIVWKLTAQAFGISTDGGRTYPFGLDAWGQAILESINAIGINASYIDTGELAVTDGDVKVFSANVGTGAVLLQDSSGNKWDMHAGELVVAASAKVGGSTAGTLVSDVSTLRTSAQQFSVDISSHATTLAQLKATYCTCSTAGATQDKVANCSDFALRTGAIISVKFTYANTAANPTLNVNGTGAKPIYLNGSALPQANWWKAGDFMTLVYNGTSWCVTDGATLTQLASTNTNVANLSLRADAFDVSIAGVQATYGTCSTVGATQEKVVTISGFAKFVGQTVTVKFTYANTAANPILKVQNQTGSVYASGAIYVNNANMTSENYWGAQEVVTFVWDGAYWRVGDGSTLSRIKVLQDSITLSVSNASLGSTASIVLSVNGSTQTKSLDLTGVRKAFASDASAIAISAGTVTFNSNTFVVNSTNFSVTATGVITATAGTIGGFTIGQSALYNMLTSLSGVTDGVYVGTDGIACGKTFQQDGKDVQYSVAFSAGMIEGRRNGAIVGQISPNATAAVDDGSGNTNTRYGLQMRGDVIDLRADILTVKGDAGEDGDSIVALEDRTVYSTYLSISSYDASTSVTMRPTERRRRFINGIAVSDQSYWYSALGSSTESLTLPTKTYVDSLILSLSQRIASLESSKPSFSLSGTTLSITA